MWYIHPFTSDISFYKHEMHTPELMFHMAPGKYSVLLHVHCTIYTLTWIRHTSFQTHWALYTLPFILIMYSFCRLCMSDVMGNWSFKRNLNTEIAHPTIMRLHYDLESVTWPKTVIYFDDAQTFFYFLAPWLNATRL